MKGEVSRDIGKKDHETVTGQQMNGECSHHRNSEANRGWDRVQSFI